MSYHAPTISAQLRTASRQGLKIIAATWRGNPAMTWLIDRERAFRERWPDERDTSPRRQRELAALLSCERVHADRCERGLPALACAECPYALGQAASDEPAPSPWQRYRGVRAKAFYDVQTRLGRTHRYCWPTGSQFHAETGEVIPESDVNFFRLSWTD